MSMNADGIVEELDRIDEERPERSEMGKAYISVDGNLYDISHVNAMVQRDEVTVICPVIVAGRKLG